MSRLAFVYSDDFDMEEIGLLGSVLESGGFEVVPVKWNDPAVQWGQFEAVLIRRAPLSTEETFPFAVWMNETMKLTPLFNSPEVIGWNVDRSFFLDYQSHGVRTPEVALAGTVEEAQKRLNEFSCDEIFVRTRAVWGDTVGPLPVDSPEILVHVKNMLDASQGVILEECLGGSENVKNKVTFVSFNGRLSHAVTTKETKKRGGDSKNIKGSGVATGTVQYFPCSPSEALVTAADYAIRSTLDIWEEKNFSHFAQVPLFGNVEVAMVDDEPILLGVDFVHPDLFLGIHPYGAARFLSAFLRQRNGFVNLF